MTINLLDDNLTPDLFDRTTKFIRLVNDTLDFIKCYDRLITFDGPRYVYVVSLEDKQKVELFKSLVSVSITTVNMLMNNINENKVVLRDLALAGNFDMARNIHNNCLYLNKRIMSINWKIKFLNYIIRKIKK